ncbi:unnamed protein product [Rotaria sordida]|uniref:NAD(P)(+)--arginine ADP-ribosyltransferase n=1 Tax=Rotaria sordida TaxID=392033 RepID=A0A814FWA9_9BILA|nr:unnamed protein product [Rotaria sordida]
MISEADILRVIDDLENNDDESGLGTTTVATSNSLPLDKDHTDGNTKLPEVSEEYQKLLHRLHKTDWKNYERMKRRTAFKLSGPYSKNKLNKEDILIISFNINDPELNQETLQKINNQVTIHLNKKTCLEHVKSIVNEKILFIISVSSVKEILSLIHDEETLHSVFVITDNSEHNSNLLKLRFSKIVDIFAQSSELLKSLQTNVQLIPKQLATFNVFNSKQSNSMNLNKDSAIFLWFQLLKDAILKLRPQSLEDAINDMVQKCQEYYQGNRIEQENIQKFKQDYENQQNHSNKVPNLAIRWYTKASFVNKMINKAMRTEDINQLYTFRFYIADLCANISRLHEEQKNYKFNIELYRGLRLSIDEINKLKENVGNTISLNGFLSASKSLKVARRFAHGPSSRKNTEPVIMIFSVRTKDKLKSIKFADLSDENLSDYPEEEEVLFDLGSVFRVENVLDPYNGEHAIIMVATDIGTQLVDQHLKLSEQSIKEDGINIVFGSLLFKSGQHDKALQYFETLLISEKENDAAVYAKIGAYYSWKNECTKAISFFQRSFDLYMDERPPNVAKASLIMHEIGNNYIIADMHSLGFACIKRAAEMYKSVFPADHFQNIIALKDIGICYILEKNYDEAKYYIEKALEMCNRILPTDHDETAACIGSMGSIYHKQNELDMALDYYMKALKMFRKLQTLPEDHPHVVATLHYLQEAKEALVLPGARIIIGDTEIRLGHSQLLQFVQSLNKSTEATDQGESGN